MAHTIRKKSQLTHRVNRIGGQVQAVARALEDEADASDILRLIAAARGAMNALMAEVLEDHIREHVAVPARGRLSAHERAHVAGQPRATEELIAVVRTYLK